METRFKPSARRYHVPEKPSSVPEISRRLAGTRFLLSEARYEVAETRYLMGLPWGFIPLEGPCVTDFSTPNWRGICASRNDGVCTLNRPCDGALGSFHGPVMEVHGEFDGRSVPI